MPRIPVFIYTADPATGNALPSVTCTVKNRITNTNVSLFSAETGGSSVTNPLTSDSLGRAFAWTERVPLKIDYSGAGITAYTEYRGDASQPTFESTLPASPYDGQEIYYQNATMATAGVVWHFRYRSGGGTYKWEYIGGPPLHSSSATGITLSTIAANTAISGDVALSIPLSGEYCVEFSTTTTHTGNNQGIYLFPTGAGLTGNGSTDGAMFTGQPAMGYPTAAIPAVSFSRVTLTGGGTLTLGYYVGLAGGSLPPNGRRTLRATPVRVG